MIKTVISCVIYKQDCSCDSRYMKPNAMPELDGINAINQLNFQHLGSTIEDSAVLKTCIVTNSR